MWHPSASAWRRQSIAALGRAVAAGISRDGGATIAPESQQSTPTPARHCRARWRAPAGHWSIAGTGCGSAAVLEAAAAVANALCSAGKQAMLCLCVPEANSLGQAMLAGPEAPDLNALQQRARCRAK